MKITECELNYTQSKKYRFLLYVEYEDGDSWYCYGDNEDECVTEMANWDEHGIITFYTGVSDEDRVDGEWVGRENFIYE